ncbi:MAG: hypothetical protein ACU84J_11760, partial [Gammaproteobacteria bacterium]
MRGKSVGRYDLMEKKRPLWPIVMLLTILLALGAGAWLYLHPQPAGDGETKIQELAVPNLTEEMTEEVQPAEDENLPEDETVTATESTGTTATEAPLTLPALENSDTLFREKVTALSPELAPWLKSDHLIENGIVI